MHLSSSSGAFAGNPLSPSSRQRGRGASAAGGAARLSQLFFDQGRLEGASQRLEDGFRDAGPELSPLAEGVDCLLLDAREDPALLCFVDRCRKKLRKAKDEVAQAMVLALLVSDACGRSGVHAAGLGRKHAQLASERRRSSGELLLGDLLADGAGGATGELRRAGKVPASGAALGQQRAVLFKAVADWLGMMPCTLQRQQESTFNIVHVAQTSCVVDLLFDPGALYEEGSAKAQEYRKMILADSEGIRPSGKPPEPPSARKELAGHMPRPPWHAEPWDFEILRNERVGRGGFGEVFHGRWSAHN
ncbi:unnamed protein product, partial [Polarella glacialis]